MDDLQVLRFESQAIRMIEKDGENWWVLKDVCEILGLTNPSMVAERLDEDERAKFGLGRQGDATIINESGLYSVILRSEKPEAKIFKKWVTSEVLPSIRKTGSYSNGKQIALADPVLLSRIESLEKTLETLSSGIIGSIYHSGSEHRLDAFLDWYYDRPERHGDDLLCEDVYTRLCIWCDIMGYMPIKKSIFYKYMAESPRVKKFTEGHYSFYKVTKNA